MPTYVTLVLPEVLRIYDDKYGQIKLEIWQNNKLLASTPIFLSNEFCEENKYTQYEFSLTGKVDNDVDVSSMQCRIFSNVMEGYLTKEDVTVIIPKPPVIERQFVSEQQVIETEKLLSNSKNRASTLE